MRAPTSEGANELVTAINDHYDNVMFSPSACKGYGGSDFHNYGYWDHATETPREGCENLMEKLLAFAVRQMQSQCPRMQLFSYECNGIGISR